MFGFVRNIVGKLQGYSGCSHCGGTWNWKQGHSIPTSISKVKALADGTPYYPSGMFPLCEECYRKLSPQERYSYCRKLWVSWGCPENKVDWNLVGEYVGLQSSTQTAKAEVN